MKSTLSAVIILLTLGSAIATAQPVSVSVAQPVTLELGAGGGISLPTGTLNTTNNTGWHVGGLARLGGWIPLSIIVTGAYHKLPNAGGSDATTITAFTGGLEYPLSAVAVRPYLSAEGMLNTISGTAANSPTNHREGLSFGIGVDFAAPGVGNFDTSLKYQMLNLWGKTSDDNDTVSQIAANISFLFNVI